jgi:hypothetical protein
MLSASSKRARSSTTTVTSLPARAAASRASATGDFAPVRYRVCLIANTFGSFAACRSRSSTGANES